MDITTLRITFTVIAAVLVVLFFVGAVRPTRARFAIWWTVSLLLFVLGSGCYLANGTSAQVVLNPLGNALGVAGAQAACCAARSLRARTLRWPWLVVAPLLAFVAGALGDPAHDTWSGGLVFLALMAIVFAITTRELVQAAAHPGEAHRQLSVSAVLARSLAAASFVLAVFYTARTVAFLAVGPHSEAFSDWFGSVPTTVLLLVQLVTVSFSMSSLSAQQQIDDLEQRAVYDQLTGLMRPQEFRNRATAVLPRLVRAGELAVVAMADLDHFKQVNDELGHAAGDDVLRAFGRAVRTVLGSRAVCGRVGGEEFCLLFPSPSLEYAESMLATTVADFQADVHLEDGRMPTVSFGVACADQNESLVDVIRRADRALYQAKSEGRSRMVRA